MTAIRGATLVEDAPADGLVSGRGTSALAAIIYNFLDYTLPRACIMVGDVGGKGAPAAFVRCIGQPHPS